MEFEFDGRKSHSNRRKHGIDFIAAQALWEDPDLLEIPARTTDEPRFLVIGKIGEQHWSGVIAYRGVFLGLTRKGRSSSTKSPASVNWR